jgi:hypothetical protein
MEGNPESAADQIGHAASRPEVGGEAVYGRLLGQPLANLLILFGSEKPRATWCSFGSQPCVALGSMFGHPLGHGDGMNAEGFGDGRLGMSSQNLLNGTPPYGFQFGSRSFASHGEDVTYATIRVQ